MARVVFHIGYPKAASSFLQDDIFQRSEELFFVSHSLTPLFYETPSPDKTRGQMDIQLGHLQEEIRQCGRTTILSDETFVTGPWLPIHIDRVENALMIRQRIHAFCPSAQIIIVLRAQYDWLASWWRQYISAMGTETLEEIIDSDFFRHRLYPSLRYNQVVQGYRELFGKEAVHVFFLADLQQRPQKFLDDLCGVLGMQRRNWPIVQRNEGRSMGINEFRRRINRYAVRTISSMAISSSAQSRFETRVQKIWKRYVAPFDRFMPQRSKVASKDLQERIRNMFATDNAELCELLDIDIARLDPAMADQIRITTERLR